MTWTVWTWKSDGIEQIIKKFLLTTCRIAISTRCDLSVVGPLLSSNHCVSDAVRYHRSATTAPDNNILSIHRSFSAGRCRSWWYRIQNSFFSLITHGDLLSRLLSHPCHPGLLFRQLDVLIFVISLINPLCHVYIAVDSFNLSQKLFYAFPALYCFLLTLFLIAARYLKSSWSDYRNVFFFFSNFKPTFP